MSAAQEPDYIRAHRHCMRNRAEIERSDICGCFYCIHTFPPSAIHSFWPESDSDGEGVTALCPNFPVDAVIGSASGFPITIEFLQQMHDYWFGPAKRERGEKTGA